MNKPEWLIVHHTATARDKTTFVAVNRYHRDKWWFKSSLGFHIGYQYFINAKGVVTQGRADTDVGAHTLGYNEKSIGICLAGNFDVELPSQAQVSSLTKILKEKMRRYNIPSEKIKPHRAFGKRNCYGKNLPDDWAMNLVKTTVPPEASGESRDDIQELVALLEKTLVVAKRLVK